MPDSITQQILQPTRDAFDRVLNQQRSQLRPMEVGTVTSVARGVARVSGLPHVQSEELLKLPGGRSGMVFNLDRDEVGIVQLETDGQLAAGDEVRRTGRLLDVPVGEGLLGRVIDPLGRPLDRRGPVEAHERRVCEQDAAAILDRLPVTVPLQTGIKVVDALVPIGRGQRELIVGDRQTGKTAIAVDTILNQRDTGVICIYCAIGRRNTAVASVVSDLKKRDSLDHTVVVVAEGDSSPGMQYVAPFAATSIGEYFMSQGKDVLIVYDDLTSHARAYRELSLLLRRPPGREAFPGDIFYLHSRLLERSTHLNERLGGGSLTALPIAETNAQNLSAYIPTNLISITDGQIYLSPDLFQKGLLPAVDVGRSVSRVGGKTQLPAYRAVAGDLRLSYSQFEELEAFSRFSSRLDDATRATLERGRRVREILKQPQYETLSVAAQIVPLLAVTEGLLDDVPLADTRKMEERLQSQITSAMPEVCERVARGEKLDKGVKTSLLEAIGKVIGS
ncbi:alternate F1F0 ATPase, F1 subunit alpha [Fuerstiella marisgermanici]|uniref:ATP synthase subunit alpha n=1 Tax=Fuerstiella marisgermanici TaxID=1891926 RepID=A0A1P8WLL4_9PLAN|nr:alternate F1F0 ATPase, F1 subunit alpha [Fuerstiella marisgermanici]APZ94945.1 ATP synthase subunit alpha [Fuerstiella marisgermanici]